MLDVDASDSIIGRHCTEDDTAGSFPWDDIVGICMTCRGCPTWTTVAMLEFRGNVAEDGVPFATSASVFTVLGSVVTTGVFPGSIWGNVRNRGMPESVLTKIDCPVKGTDIADDDGARAAEFPWLLLLVDAAACSVVVVGGLDFCLACILAWWSRMSAMDIVFFLETGGGLAPDYQRGKSNI